MTRFEAVIEFISYDLWMVNDMLPLLIVIYQMTVPIYLHHLLYY